MTTSNNSSTSNDLSNSSFRMNSFLLFIKSFSFITNTNEILLIEQHWTEIIKEQLKLTTLNVNNIVKSFDSYFQHITNSYPLVSRFEFLFKKSDTLEKAIIEYIMFKLVDYPVITTKIITRSFISKYPDYCSQFSKGSIRTIFNETLDEFYTLNLLEKQIIEGTRPKNTNCYLAAWHKPKNLERVMEIYGFYKNLAPKKKLKTKQEKVQIEIEKKEIREEAQKIHKKKKVQDPSKIKEDHDLKVVDSLLNAEVVRDTKIATKQIQQDRKKRKQICSIGGCQDEIKFVCNHCGKLFCVHHMQPGGKYSHNYCEFHVTDKYQAKISLKTTDFTYIEEQVNLELEFKELPLQLEEK